MGGNEYGKSGHLSIFTSLRHVMMLVKCIRASFVHFIKDTDGMYGTAKKKRPGYLVGNLVATNWPIEKALHAIGYNQIPTK